MTTHRFSIFSFIVIGACTISAIRAMEVPPLIGAAPAGMGEESQSAGSFGRNGLVYSFVHRIRGSSPVVHNNFNTALGRAIGLGAGYETAITCQPGGWRTINCRRIPFWRRGPFVAAFVVAAATVGASYLIGRSLPQ